MASFRIRPFRRSDGDALASLHQRAIMATPEAFYSHAERESWSYGLSADLYEPGEGDLEVAVDEADVAVAFCHRLRDEVLGLYVDPDWQRAGIGDALITRAEEAMLAAGLGKARIHASNSSVAFYQRRGYRVVETTSHKTRGGLALPSTRLEKVIG